MRTSRTGKAARARRQRGLTLIELLVVLSIIGMMAVLVAPMAVRSLPAMELRTTAEDLRGSFRAARSAAMRHNRDSWVEIDLNAKTYRHETARRPASLPDGLSMEAVIARSEMLEPGRGRIRFHPDGTSTGGEVRLIGEAQAIELKVDWFDGSISVVETDVDAQ